jgi:hypothetical protein
MEVTRKLLKQAWNQTLGSKADLMVRKGKTNKKSWLLSI